MVELLKKSAIKDLVRKVDKDMRCPDETVEGLEKVVKDLVSKAVNRAKENGRKTLRPFDF
jgi:histone H3/H4